MTTPVSFHQLIERDLRSAALYYEAEGGPKLAKRFVDDVEATVQGIQMNPLRHHFGTSGLRRAQLRTFPYHVLYKVDDNGVRVLVLRHDRRRPSYGLGRT